MTLRDAKQAAAVALSSGDTVWPAEVDADMDVIAGANFKEIADLNQIIEATSADGVFGIPFSVRSDEEKAAGPRVRTLLGLELDTQASCANR
ncbi:hypothetical protein C5D25_07345 [Rathayibacter sp. AY1D7]|nr:hypothetical protein C5D25_07345 [Rathayibacter sp. AY1D7]